MDENRTVLIGRKVAAMLNADGRVPLRMIELRSGAFVDPFDLDSELVFIEDIAYNLARIARFTGCSSSYGAEHALIVEELLKRMGASPLGRLHGIMHDGHEYVLGDVPKPLKYRSEYAFYRAACDRAQAVIYDGLGLPSVPEEFEPTLKHADVLSLLIEARRGLPSKAQSWRMTTQELINEADEHALHIAPKGVDHAALEAEFLRRYALLRRDAQV